MFDAQTPPDTANALLRYGDPAGLTRPRGAHAPAGSKGPACRICGADARDAAGTTKHEGACPLFMRGPDTGGDPHEWPTLFTT